MSQSNHSTDQLLQTLYSELRGLAVQKLRHERADHTLQATALVNEVYLKLRDQREASGWESRSHFMRASAEAMRRILVDSARAKKTRKRGGDVEKEVFDDAAVELPLPPDELLAIHDCLDQFAKEEPIQAELVKLRVFAGLSHVEAAKILDLSRATADRYWSYAKVRLMSLMDPGTTEETA